MANYSYVTKGQGAGGQTWHVDGCVKVESDGSFLAAIDAAMRDGFMQLTQGKAVYGMPGVGCNGPYKITHFTIERT